MRINRALGRNFIESQMIDRCRIYRDVSGVFNAALDEVTGKLIDSLPEEDIYEGKCLISRVLTKDKEFYEGSMPKFANGYKLLVPATMTDGELGDFVEFTQTSYDPRILGMTFRITDIEVFSHTTYRRIMVTGVEDNIGSLKGAE